MVFVCGEAIGLQGDEAPQEIEANLKAMAWLEAIRCNAAVCAGLAESTEHAGRSLNRPFIAVVAPSRDAVTLAGTTLPGSDVDLLARGLSMGRLHRALSLTMALCLAAAARIDGTVVHDLVQVPTDQDENLRIGHPSGTLSVAA